jgi:hypothetical protein
VKNLTISLPESTLEALREKAKSNGKSLNAWLRELLSREAIPDTSWLDAMRRSADSCANSVPDAGRSAWTWNREEIYEERLLRH